jgi:hypothetical protein
MNAEVRGKLEMGERVQLFGRAHPIEDTGLKPVFDQLDESLSRGHALITQQAQGAQRAKAANAQRRDLRSLLWVGLLRLIANICVEGAKLDPALATLKPPARQAPNRVFIAGAEALVTGAREHLELLGRFGLSAGVLDEAAKVVARYRAATEDATEARQSRVQASAELEEVGARIMVLVQRLDGLNRHRFADQPEILAAWESARNLVTIGPRVSTGSPSTGGAGAEAKAA